MLKTRSIAKRSISFLKWTEVQILRFAMLRVFLSLSVQLATTTKQNKSNDQLVLKWIFFYFNLVVNKRSSYFNEIFKVLMHSSTLFCIFENCDIRNKNSKCYLWIDSDDQYVQFIWIGTLRASKEQLLLFYETSD